jgi:hypothetical protein
MSVWDSGYSHHAGGATRTHGVRPVLHWAGAVPQPPARATTGCKGRCSRAWVSHHQLGGRRARIGLLLNSG